MKKITVTLSFLFLFSLAFTQPESDSLILNELDLQTYIDSVNNSFHYQHGKIEIEDGKAWIHVPEGFKFLDANQAATVIFDLWGNQPCAISGLLLKENEDPLSMDFTYAIEINYSPSGYISDDDAQDIDYDELLEDMQTDIEDQNQKLIEAGYSPHQLVGWASKPYYDENRKILFWAKEFKFGDDEENTLNYNYIFLGRDGYFTYNVIGTMDVLDEVRNEQNNFLSSLTYTPGNTYNDFDPDYDKIAAIGIGGLVAGKIIAKTGILVLLAKFWKLIAIGVVGVGGFISRVFFRGDK